jgi:hypothetical protein
VPRCVELFWNCFNFWPGPSAESQVKMDLFYIITTKCAM